MTRAARIRLSLGISLIVATVIGWLTLMPAEDLPAAPGSDKLHHFIAFAALVLPVAAVRPRFSYWAVPLAVAYGGAIELIQPHFGRNGEWGDFLANTAGALAGAALGALLHAWPLRQLARAWHGRRAAAPDMVETVDLRTDDHASRSRKR